MPTPLSIVDESIDSPLGQLFVRRWLNPSRRAAWPIILLHDSLGSVALWRDFPTQLSQRTGHPVIAYDRLGFGQSDPYPGKLPLDFIAEEANGSFAALLKALDIQDFLLFGHSVGGGMAVNIAARYPERCRGLITESAQAFVEDRTVAGIRAAQALFEDPSQQLRLNKYHGDKTHWVLEAWIDSWLHPDFASWSLADILPKVVCPLLAIHGENDEYGSEKHPNLLVERTAGRSTRHLMPETGHVPHREQENAVLLYVADFLESLPPTEK